MSEITEDERALVTKYENKIKHLFKKQRTKTKSTKSTKSKNSLFGGKKSHKNRTRKHRK